MTTGKQEEQKAWDSFKRGMSPRAVLAKRVENLVVSGMPDVIAINKRGAVFWLENKALEHWPARTATYPLRTAFKPGQLPFAREWQKWGGHAFVLLRVETEFFLLNPLFPLDTMTKEVLLSHALVTGKAAIVKFLEEL